MATTQAPVLRGDTYWINIQLDGKRLRKSLDTKDPKLAQEAFTRELAEFYRTRKFKERPRKTVNEAFDQWLKERGTKRSIADDERKIAYLRPKLGTKQLSELTAADIERELEEAAAHLAKHGVEALSVVADLDASPDALDAVVDRPSRRQPVLDVEGHESQMLILPDGAPTPSSSRAWGPCPTPGRGAR